MKALSLFGVFVVARVLVLAGRDLPRSAWAVPAYLWQDALAALCFAALDLLCRRRPWLSWGVYVVVVLYVALNVPVACLFSTPLTWPMLRAARGTLADSITHHVTIPNVLRMLAVVAAAVALPLLLRRRGSRLRRRASLALVLGAVVLVLVGPFAAARVATRGLERNVVVVLVTTALPRVEAADLAGDWRLSPFGSPRGEDLSRFRGAAAGRNVVVVHLESTAAGHLRPYGADTDPMPHLTELSRHAILFENAYTAYPETIKSFVAAHCSVWPALDTGSEVYGRPPAPPLASTLHAAGYRTGLFHSGRFGYLGMDAVVRGQGFDTAEDAGDIGGEHDSSFGIDEPSAVRRVLSWIDGLPPGRPFFVTYLPIAGHHPYEVPERGPFPGGDDTARYHNALHYADAALGQLLDGLRARGLERNTLVVVFGDHGEAFGEHGGNFGHTLFLYEENLRVPLVVSAPGLTLDPVRVGRVVGLIDVAPTVLDLLGLAAPPEYQGRSLLDGEGGMALFCTDYTLGLLGLRDGRWKMIHELESGRSQLYDLDDDPGERRDLAGIHPERVEEYRDHLRRWASAQKYRATRGGR
jgi:arylsulfatase A-like enzyme